MPRTLPRRAVAPALLALLLVAPATAQSGGAVDEEWGHEPRELDFRSDARGFEATSLRDSGRGHDGLAVSYGLDDATLAYRFTDLRNGTPLAVDLRFTALLEYRDRDGDGAYGPGDEVVRSKALPGAEATLSTERVGEAHRATALYPVLPDDGELLGEEPPAPGTLRLVFTVTPRPANVDGRAVAPLEVGVDVHVEAYPYAAHDTRLALQAGVAGDQRLLPGGLDRPLQLEAGPLRTFVAWSDAVEVDGAEVPLAATQLRSGPLGAGTDATLLFPYGRGEDVHHAMTVGTQRLPEGAAGAVRAVLEGDGLVYALAVLGSAGLVGVPAVRRLRGRA